MHFLLSVVKIIEAEMKIVILAAGKGSRLGIPRLPKPLTPLVNGYSILGFQLKNISKYVSLHHVLVIVGYQKEKIMEEFPDLLYVYNPCFAQENTAKSLLRALYKIEEDLLWINGDVIFHPTVLKAALSFGKSNMIVNDEPVGEEEIKYRTDPQGQILEVSKHVSDAQGEALGLNFLKEQDLSLFKEGLMKCSPTDYFERGLEFAIEKGLSIYPNPVDSSLCTEVDFPQDLARANKLIEHW